MICSLVYLCNTYFICAYYPNRNDVTYIITVYELLVTVTDNIMTINLVLNIEGRAAQKILLWEVQAGICTATTCDDVY